MLYKYPTLILLAMSTSIQYIKFFIIYIGCMPLTAPTNGNIDCSLGEDGQPSLGDSCTFTCDSGHEMSGSVTRSCQIDGSWSGTESICTRGTVTLFTKVCICACYILNAI